MKAYIYSTCTVVFTYLDHHCSC